MMATYKFSTAGTCWYLLTVRYGTEVVARHYSVKAKGSWETYEWKGGRHGRRASANDAKCASDGRIFGSIQV